ncbi:MAG TPA: hypothetical protein VKY41_07600 [Xanthomarina sp.]|nr:hypothetical protein [Xanthomarina sp.]
MKVINFAICFLFFLSSCKHTEESSNSVKEEVVYDMYQPSEMANLMNEMYAQNLKLKQDILSGKVPTQFPLDFLKIHTAELSDFKSRNETFQSFSKLFIQTEKEIFNTESELPVEERFNYAVNLCISCHQTECTGPIPRIRKLLIK